jgi:hypothetical protein
LRLPRKSTAYGSKKAISSSFAMVVQSAILISLVPACTHLACHGFASAACPF